MTDIRKVEAFERACLKPGQTLDTADLSSVQACLDQFLAKRYFMQVNRGTSSLFKWVAIVGLQDLATKGARFEHAQAESDDLFDAIFDACVQAASMFSESSDPAL